MTKPNGPNLEFRIQNSELNTVSTPEEILLISRVLLLNDERAFGRLMKRYLRPVRHYFLIQTGGDEALSDDLTQETFIRVWRGLDTYKRLSAFGTWVYRIAFNTLQNHLAGAKRHLRLDDEHVAHTLQTLTTETDYNAEEIAALHRAIAQLSEGEKTCITLFYLEEMSIKEIAAVTEMSVPAIKTALSRGRNHLRTLLTEE